MTTQSLLTNLTTSVASSTGLPGTAKPALGCGNEVVKMEYWVYATLPLMGIIVVTFAFFEERIRLWPNCCYNRPGIPYPANLVDSYEDRWSYASAFCAMSSSVVLLFFGEWFYNPPIDHFPTMVRGTVSLLISIANVILISAVFFPLLICLRIRVKHSFIGNIVGLFYTNIWLTYNLMNLIYCQEIDNLLSKTTTAVIGPVFINYVFLNITFTVGLFTEIRKWLRSRKGNVSEVIIKEEDDFKQSHYYERVKFLLSPPQEEDTKLEVPLLTRTMGKIWKSAPGFRYSTRNICTLALTVITTYQIGLLYISKITFIIAIPRNALGKDSSLYKGLAFVNATSYIWEARDFFKIAEDTFWTACYIAIVLAVSYNFLAQISYRERTLLLWRGVKDFCPKEEFGLSALVVSNLRFSGYSVAFAAWGFIINQFLSWLILFVVMYLIIRPLQKDDGNGTFILDLLEGYWLTLLVGFAIYYVQVAFSHFTFLQKEQEQKRNKVHLSLNNRRLFHVTVYITLFLNVLVGLASCLMRIIKAIGIGVLFIGRIDKCTLMRGWELWDPGFKSYLGFLQLEVAHTHPVLITFCYFCWKSIGKDMKEKKLPLAFWRKKSENIGVFGSSETGLVSDQERRGRKKLWPRNKWFVALTLMRNRSLTVERMRISPELQLVKEQLAKERIEKGNRNGLQEIAETPSKEPSPNDPEDRVDSSAKEAVVVITNPTSASTETAEILKDSATKSPTDASRPATRLSMVAWEEQTVSQESNGNVDIRV